MWCKKCIREAFDEVCDLCGGTTEQDIPIEIYWCKECRIPIIKLANELSKTTCLVCARTTVYLCVDLRPVFPEERLLLEILIDKPLAYIESSVWCSGNRYYIDGESKVIPLSLFHQVDVNEVINQFKKYKDQNSYEYYNIFINRFACANQERLNSLKDEAYSFIQTATSNYSPESIVISFSGGKDSTVTADLAKRALSEPRLVHIFGDTTLEFPLTLEYADRFRKNNPKAIFKVAKNREQDFYKVCEDIGPPARMLRWCCSMFKTGPITRVLNNMYRNRSILTFYGIRKCESVSRSKYKRIEDNAEAVKIQKQKVASPIFYWKDIEIWLYLLGEQLDFNDAYRLGYDRVGCWCCPNNNDRAQFLSQIYMPEQANRWRNFLVDFAKKIGKPDPEVYVDSGKWKARQGGNGVVAAQDVKIKFTNCTAEENAKIYNLNRRINDSFIQLFNPFGRIAPELGRKLINEKMKRMGTITHDANVYFSINVIWPEMLFVLMALNDFCRFHAYKLTKKRYDMMLDKSVIWDHNLAQIRLLQAEVVKCLQEEVEGKTYSRIINMMIRDYTWLENYITQYLDVLNVRYLELDREKRKKNLSIMVKRLTEKGEEYRSIERTILEAAKEYDSDPDDIRLNLVYPEQIDW